MKTKAISVLLISAFTVLGCASGPATEGDEPEQVAAVEQEQAASRSEKDPNELICKKIKKTGSMLKTKVCATREEWERSENLPELLDSHDLY